MTTIIQNQFVILSNSNYDQKKEEENQHQSKGSFQVSDLWVALHTDVVSTGK